MNTDKSQGLDFQSALLHPRRIDLHDQFSGPNAETAHHNQPAAESCPCYPVPPHKVQSVAGPDRRRRCGGVAGAICAFLAVAHGQSAWAKAGTLTMVLPDPAQYNNITRGFRQTSPAANLVEALVASPAAPVSLAWPFWASDQQRDPISLALRPLAAQVCFASLRGPLPALRKVVVF